MKNICEAIFELTFNEGFIIVYIPKFRMRKVSKNRTDDDVVSSTNGSVSLANDDQPEADQSGELDDNKTSKDNDDSLYEDASDNNRSRSKSRKSEAEISKKSDIDDNEDNNSDEESELSKDTKKKTPKTKAKGKSKKRKSVKESKKEDDDDKEYEVIMFYC